MLVTLPFKLVNPLNKREFWATRAKRAAEHRAATRMALSSRRDWRPDARPVVVTLTRISPRPFDEHDALPASMKHVVDGIADAMGLASDRTEGVTWVYGWRKASKPKEEFVELLVEAV